MKVAIIGVGSVGSTIAYALLLKDTVSEIILVDINFERCAGEVKDLADVLGFSASSRVYQGTHADAKMADIIIISAGYPQKLGQSRVELYEGNKKIISSIIDELKGGNKDAILIMVTNPLDLMTYVALEESDLAAHQIFGTGTFLDTHRLKHLLACNTMVAEE